ncbi:MAG: glycosyltransferase family 4 protein [Hyphomonadaceae bacterium]|nr:glycosyltransferase family 4 protein [Hyphomonadaceae bacterium]
MGFDSATAIVHGLNPERRIAARPALRRAAMIGNFPPRKCGIATFTRDSFESLRTAMPKTTWSLVAMEDRSGGHVYPDAVTHVIPQDDLASYESVADDLNRSGVETVFVQHEFGIYGGDSGSHLLVLLRRLRMPVIVTLHTVLEKPSPVQKKVLEEIISIASAVIVMSEMGADILDRVHGAGPKKVHVIPHGAPERPFSSPELFKAPLGLAGHKVIMTFGLLSPNKGIETIIKGLPSILARHPDAVYLIAGATHPHLVAHAGEAYRDSLIELARSLGVVDHLRFVNRFLGDDELVDLLQAADLYVTPYLTEAQITSGTLAYAIALGKPVISTPYWHAKEALADDVGILCAFNDTRAFATAVTDLLSDPAKRDAMARRAYSAGEPSRWRKVADSTIDLALACRSTHEKRKEEAFRNLARPKLDGLLRMSDDCGVYQHSRFGAPDRRHGYCTDDTARALSLMARLASEGIVEPAALKLANSCAAFLSHAWNEEAGRFRNFMSFDRRWLDDGGSDDCCARALEAVCLVAREWPQGNLRDWAADLAREALRHVGEWSSLRSQALIIKACLSAEGSVIGEEEVRRHIYDCGTVLLTALQKGRADGHGWFEPCFAYDNARLPEALILAGERLQDPDMLSMGLEALELVMKLQTTKQGWFSPVATSSFDTNGADHAHFDQQPIEALATVEACFAAWHATGDTQHCVAARLAFEWFGGFNVHGLALANPGDGICHDGLTVAGLNGNHGAESILSYHLAAASVRTFLIRQPAGAN